MKKQMNLAALTLMVLFTVISFTQCSKADESASTSLTTTKTSIVVDMMDQLVAEEVSPATTDDVIDCIYTCLNSMPVQDLSEGEMNALTFIREEELLAHDIYVALYEAYNLPVFNNISKSENIHTTAILALIEKYSLTDPAADHQAGVFVNQDIQNLYNALLTQGMLSLNDGLVVGATIEDYDIADLIVHLGDGTDNEDMLYVMQQLYKGSRNHLRAFHAHLQFRNIPYTPQFIDLNLYNDIVNSDWEIGNGFCFCNQTETNSLENVQTQ